jgi:hypothetical protein
MIYLGLRAANQRVTLGFDVCNSGAKIRTVDVFSFGDDFVAFWTPSGKEIRPTTRITIRPGEVKAIEIDLSTGMQEKLPFVMLSEQGKVVDSVYVDYLLSDQPSQIPLQLTINQLQSGWAGKYSPPYRICVGNPPPFYHLSPVRKPDVQIQHGRSSNGESHPRGCGGKWAECQTETSGDGVCSNVTVQGHEFHGAHDETDFVWFDLVLTAWYDRSEAAPEWVDLKASPGKKDSTGSTH